MGGRKIEQEAAELGPVGLPSRSRHRGPGPACRPPVAWNGSGTCHLGLQLLALSMKTNFAMRPLFRPRRLPLLSTSSTSSFLRLRPRLQTPSRRPRSGEVLLLGRTPPCDCRATCPRQRPPPAGCSLPQPGVLPLPLFPPLPPPLQLWNWNAELELGVEAEVDHCRRESGWL